MRVASVRSETREPASRKATTSEAAHCTASSKASPGSWSIVRSRTSISVHSSFSTSRTIRASRCSERAQWMRRRGSPGAQSRRPATTGPSPRPPLRMSPASPGEPRWRSGGTRSTSG